MEQSSFSGNKECVYTHVDNVVDFFYQNMSLAFMPLNNATSNGNMCLLAR